MEKLIFTLKEPTIPFVEASKEKKKKNIDLEDQKLSKKELKALKKEAKKEAASKK